MAPKMRGDENTRKRPRSCVSRSTTSASSQLEQGNSPPPTPPPPITPRKSNTRNFFMVDILRMMKWQIQIL